MPLLLGDLSAKDFKLHVAIVIVIVMVTIYVAMSLLSLGDIGAKDFKLCSNIVMAFTTHSLITL